jgi:hypothetical protein
MIQLTPMKVYQVGIFAAFVLVLVCILIPYASHAQDLPAPEDTGKVAPDTALTQYGFNAQDVESVVSRLASGDEYKYDESTLDDPPWLLRLKEWWRNFRQRMGSGPMNNLDFEGMTTVSFIIVAVVVVLIFGVFLYRMLERRYGSSIAGSGEGSDGEFGNIGAWGDTGVSKATEIAATGMFRDAISVLFKSALRGLSNVGWINYRSSGGSRIYLRQLRRSAEIYPIYRDFLSRFEVAFYRKDSADEQDWSYMYETYGNLARTASANPAKVPTRNR